MEESSLQQQSTLHIAIAVISFTICYPFVLRFYYWLVDCVGGNSQSTRNDQDDRSILLKRMEAAYFTRRHVPGYDPTFTLFVDLGEDLMTHILSFVAEAPFEAQNDNFMAALTHSLPLVSKQFYRLTKTNDDFWKDAILRQVAREAGGAGGLWNEGLQSVSLTAEEAQPTNNSSSSAATTATSESVAQLLDRICDRSETTGAEIYKTILNTTIRFTGPIFCMPQRVKLGVPYGLHFFEPRYRRLMADIMAPYPAVARQGGPMVVAGGDTMPPPVFIHAHAHAHLQRGTPACLVQVIRCHIYPDGRADVFLLPTCHVRTELLWEIPHTGHLYCGQFLRLGPRGAESEHQQAAGAALRRHGQY